jgi:hypothetical protein
MKTYLRTQRLRLASSLLIGAVTLGTVGRSNAQIIYPAMNQSNVPTSGRDLKGVDHPGVRYELEIREGSETGPIVASRTKASTPVLSMDNLQRNREYWGSIRVIGLGHRYKTRFFTGPIPATVAVAPGRVELIDGDDSRVIAGSVTGPIDEIYWLNPSGLRVSSSKELELEAIPETGGAYSFVARGPGGTSVARTEVVVVSEPWIEGLAEYVAIPTGTPHFLSASIQGGSLTGVQWYVSYEDGRTAAVPGATSQTILIQPSPFAQTVVYTLKASNAAGETEASIDVEYGDAPRPLGGAPTLTVARGQSFTIGHDFIGSEPMLSTLILPNGTRWPIGEEQNVHVKLASADMAGTWTHQVRSPFGSAEVSIPVVVQEGNTEPPPSDLVLKMEQPEPHIVRLSWPLKYVVDDSVGKFMIQSTADLIEWYDWSVEDLEITRLGERFVTEFDVTETEDESDPDLEMDDPLEEDGDDADDQEEDGESDPYTWREFFRIVPYTESE